uniref:ubiquitinyl hydrolase 1 n=1 Tax=Panagrolaimus davidi TaxID=227884 RepID=A0A914P4Y7_9BILA
MVQSFITKQQFATPPLGKTEEKEEVKQQLTRSIREPRIERWREKNAKKRCIVAEECLKFRERPLVPEFERRNSDFKQLKAFGMSDASKKIGYHPIPSQIPIPMQRKTEYIEYTAKIPKMKATTILKPIIIKRKNCIAIGKKRGGCNGKTKLPHQTFKCSNPNVFQKFHKKCNKESFHVKNAGIKPTKVRGPQIWNGSSPFHSYILRHRKQKFVHQSKFCNDKLPVLFNIMLLGTVIALFKTFCTSTIIERLLAIVADILLYVIKEFSMNDAFWLTIICMINFVNASLNFKKRPKEVSVKSEIFAKQLIFNFNRPVPIFCHEFDTIEVVCEKVVADLSLQKGSFYLSWNGKPLKEINTVGDYGIKSLDHINVHLRQRGGGMERLSVEQASNNTPTNVGKNQLINEHKERLAISKANINSLHQHYNSCSICKNKEDGCHELRQILATTSNKEIITMLITYNLIPQNKLRDILQTEFHCRKFLDSSKENNISNNIHHNVDNTPPLNINVNEIIKAFDQLTFEKEDTKHNLDVNGLKQLQLKQGADDNNNDGDIIGTIFMFTAKNVLEELEITKKLNFNEIPESCPCCERSLLQVPSQTSILRHLEECQAEKIEHLELELKELRANISNSSPGHSTSSFAKVHVDGTHYNATTKLMPPKTTRATAKKAYCGQHALNHIMQQSMFNVVSMTDAANTIAINLAGAEDDPLYEHFDDQGNYSWEVLEVALKPHGCHLEQLNKPEYRDRYDNPQLSEAYLVNQGKHWFSIRRLNDIWILFDSLMDGARRIDNIQKYFRRMKENGTTIYVIIGNIPDVNVSEIELTQLQLAKLPQQLPHQSKQPIPDSKKNVANIERRYIRISDSDSDDYVKPSSFKKQTPSKTSNAETPTESTTRQRPKRPPIPPQNSSDSITIDSDSDSNVKKGSAEKSKTGKTRSTTKKQPEPTKPTKKKYQTAKPKPNTEKLSTDPINTSSQNSTSEDPMNYNDSDSYSDTPDPRLDLMSQITPELITSNTTYGSNNPITSEKFFNILKKQLKPKDIQSTMYILSFFNATNDPEQMLYDAFYYGFTEDPLQTRIYKHKWDALNKNKGPLVGLTDEQLSRVVIIMIRKGLSTSNKILEAIYIFLAAELPPVGDKNVKIELINCSEIEALINLHSNQRENILRILTETLETAITSFSSTLPIQTSDSNIETSYKTRFQKLLDILMNTTLSPRDRLLAALEFEYPHSPDDPQHHSHLNVIVQGVLQNLEIAVARYLERDTENYEFIYFKCDWPECNYVCNLKYHLSVHYKTHTGEKPHKCDWEGCNYQCIQSNNLTVHMKTHTGEKPNKCDWEGCDYECIQASNIKDHYKTHTGEKQHKCDWNGCDYECIQSSNLQRHIDTVHKQGKRHQCRNYPCKETFGRKDSRDRHEKCRCPFRN